MLRKTTSPPQNIHNNFSNYFLAVDMHRRNVKRHFISIQRSALFLRFSVSRGHYRTNPVAQSPVMFECFISKRSKTRWNDHSLAVPLPFPSLILFLMSTSGGRLNRHAYSRSQVRQTEATKPEPISASKFTAKTRSRARRRGEAIFIHF